MAKKKKGRGTAVARGNPKNSSRKPADPADKDRKVQKQIYITQDLIDSLENLRAAREAEMREEFGQHCDLSWSQFTGSVLHDHVKKANA